MLLFAAMSEQDKKEMLGYACLFFMILVVALVGGAFLRATVDNRKPVLEQGGFWVWMVILGIFGTPLVPILIVVFILIWKALAGTAKVTGKVAQLGYEKAQDVVQDWQDEAARNRENQRQIDRMKAEAAIKAAEEARRKAEEAAREAAKPTKAELMAEAQKRFEEVCAAIDRLALPTPLKNNRKRVAQRQLDLELKAILEGRTPG